MICCRCRGQCTIHSPNEVDQSLQERRRKLAFARRRSSRFAPRSPEMAEMALSYDEERRLA